MINFFFVIVLLATYTLCGVAAKPTILTGMVTHVRDGDTIEVGKIPIRLNGVSAPELHELLGNEWKKRMDKENWKGKSPHLKKMGMRLQ